MKDFLPKAEVDEPFYTVAEAMRLTGFSSTKFRYAPNMEALDELGADLSGRVWRIPRKALIELGWLTSDAPLTAPRETIPQFQANKPSQELEQLNEELTALKKDNKKLREEMEVKEMRLVELQAKLTAKSEEIENLTRVLTNRQ